MLDQILKKRGTYWIKLLVPGKSKQYKCNFQNPTLSVRTFNTYLSTARGKTYNEVKQSQQTIAVVGIFTAFMHIPIKGFTSSILIAKINIYIYNVHINHIYIALSNFVNVTMYCYSMSYVISFTTCIPECVTQQNRCLTSTSVDRHNTEIRGKRKPLTAGLWKATCVSCIIWHKLRSHSRDTMKLYCTHCQYTVHCMMTVLLKYSILHENEWM